MDGTTKEVAKAAQEMAKAAQEGIRATEKLGTFAARLVQEPAETIVGILTDRLRFTRWRRQVRLLEEAEKVLRDRGLAGRLLPVPPKLALPILENATLEEDDSLQDIWVRLLVAAADPALQSKVRTAFVEVIKQFEPIDAVVLHFCYEKAHARAAEFNAQHPKHDDGGYRLVPSDISVKSYDIRQRFHLDREAFRISIDNLIRLRCIASYLEEDEVEGKDGESQTFTHDHQYDEVSVTPFGCSFVETCMCP